MKDDTISRKEAIEAVSHGCQEFRGIFGRCEENILALPSAQPECDKKFMMLKVIDLNGRPYYSIIYLENGNEFEGYSSYDLKVISEYLKRYFGFAQPEQPWIPCSERLPEINQTVLLSTTDGEVIVGYRYKPDIVWQVTANDGRKIWVYDPENYPGNIDELPKAETCGFENRDNCWLSVTSINYELKFAGISAWMPLPEPYREEERDG